MNTTLQRGLAGVWVLSVSIGICRADDWPQWLGPQRDSVWRETGILDQFPAQGTAGEMASGGGRRLCRTGGRGRWCVCRRLRDQRRPDARPQP